MNEIVMTVVLTVLVMSVGILAGYIRSLINQINRTKRLFRRMEQTVHNLELTTLNHSHPAPVEPSITDDDLV